VDDERTQSLLLVQAAHLKRPPMNVHIPVHIIQPSARVFLGEVILTNCSVFLWEMEDLFPAIKIRWICTIITFVAATKRFTYCICIPHT
jgi:hypothetical protein